MRTTARRRMSVAVSGTAMTALLLTGCGGNGGDSDEGGAGAGDDKSSGDSSGTPREDSGQGAKAVRAAHSTTVEKKTAKMTMTSKATAGKNWSTVKGTGVVDLDDGTSDMTLTTEGQKIGQRVVDNVLYQKLPPAQAGQLPGGAEWMKVDLEKFTGDAGQFSDPTESVDYAKGVSGDDVEKVGEETIDGEKTTHYKVPVDVDALTEGDEKQKKLLEGVGDTIPLEIWLDDDGVMRQQRVVMDVERPEGETAGPAKIKSETTTRLSDFGTDVDVKAPPKGDTADMTKELAQQQPGADA